MLIFLYIIYVVVSLLRESYLEFVAAEYYCDKCGTERTSRMGFGKQNRTEH